MANEIKLNCIYGKNDVLEALRTNGNFVFQIDGKGENNGHYDLNSVYVKPDDAIEFAEKVIKLANEMKGGK